MLLSILFTRRSTSSSVFFILSLPKYNLFTAFLQNNVDRSTEVIYIYISNEVYPVKNIFHQTHAKFKKREWWVGMWVRGQVKYFMLIVLSYNVCLNFILQCAIYYHGNLTFCVTLCFFSKRL